MKTIITLSCLALASFSASAQIPNAGFENWSNSAGYNTPDNWSTINAMTAPMSVYTAEKGTPGNPGTSYLKLTSRTVSGMGVMPGIAATGQINTTTMKVTGGFPSTARPQSLTGSWQYMGGNASDMGFVRAYFTKWNMSTMKRDTVAKAEQTLTGMAMSWAPFTMAFTYLQGFNPDTAVVILSASGMTPANSSYLYVDNLAFSGSVATAIANTVSGISGLNIYPVPATGELNVSFGSTTAQAYTIRLVDASGKTVSTQSMKGAQGQNKAVFDTHALAAGAYLLSISNGAETSTTQVTIR